MRAPALAPKRLSVVAACAFVAACALLGCNVDNPGDEPPPATLYFPNAMALAQPDPAEPARYLLVANSNFDLRYKSGTLQAYSLDALDDELASCQERGDDECGIPPTDVLEDEVRINSF